MDHLPLPYGSQIEAEDRAPYIAEEYDGGPFLTYPERSRFFELYKLFLSEGKLAIYRLPGDCDHLLADLEIFAQTWCFFGLLHEVFGTIAEPGNFIVTIDGLRVLSTACLGDVIETWLRSGLPSMENLEYWATQRLECISRSLYFLLGIVGRMISYDKIVMKTIACLAETLSMAIRHVAKIKGLDAPLSLLRRPFGYLDALVSNGWNPDTVESLRQGGLNGLCTFVYAAKIPLKQPPGSPSLPEGQRAVPRGNATSRHETHICSSPECYASIVNINKLHGILESSGIALLNVAHLAESQSKEIEILAYEPGVPYIALSHVWSEGMGNSESNTLPSCHLQYVAQMARNILSDGNGEDRPLLVWLDTLCCPVASIEHRNMCLQSMRRIYEEAAHVLVISATLRDCSSDQLDCIEICARLMFSPWMTRLWTLQEGALARKMWVGLKDMPIDMSHIETLLEQACEQSLVHRPVSLYLLWYFQYVRMLYSNERKQGRHTGTEYIRKVLLGRAVTEPADEPLCLATLLDLSPQSIIDCRPEDRMAEFWNTMSSSGRKIPRRIIFSRGPRLPNTGFRWSPASLLRQDVTHFRAASVADAAVLSADGLRFSWPGCSMLLTMPLPTDDRAMVDIVHGRAKSWFNEHSESIEIASISVLFRHPDLGWFKASDVVGPTVDQQSLRLLDLMRSCQTPVGFIFEGELREMQHENDTIKYLAGEIIRRDGDVIYLLSQAGGLLSRLDPPNQKQYETSWTVLKKWMNTQVPRTSLEGSSVGDAQTLLARVQDQQLKEACARASQELSAEGYELSENTIWACALNIALLEGCEVQEDFDNQQKWCLIQLG